MGKCLGKIEENEKKKDFLQQQIRNDNEYGKKDYLLHPMLNEKEFEDNRNKNARLLSLKLRELV